MSCHHNYDVNSYHESTSLVWDSYASHVRHSYMSMLQVLYVDLFPSVCISIFYVQTGPFTLLQHNKQRKRTKDLSKRIWLFINLSKHQRSRRRGQGQVGLEATCYNRFGSDSAPIFSVRSVLARRCIQGYVSSWGGSLRREERLLLQYYIYIVVPYVHRAYMSVASQYGVVSPMQTIGRHDHICYLEVIRWDTQLLVLLLCVFCVFFVLCHLVSILLYLCVFLHRVVVLQCFALSTTIILAYLNCRFLLLYCVLSVYYIMLPFGVIKNDDNDDTL